MPGESPGLPAHEFSGSVSRLAFALAYFDYISDTVSYTHLDVYKRQAQQLGVKAHFICADARHLPLRAGVVDVVFSYSVIQHLCREDVAQVIETSNRVLKPCGELLVQMPNVMGLRCFYQWARRGCNDGSGFDVRYWTLGQLRKAFGSIGPVDFEIDCFFGIGLQPKDADLMPVRWQALLKVSEILRRLEGIVPGLAWMADSVYVHVVKLSLIHI